MAEKYKLPRAAYPEAVGVSGAVIEKFFNDIEENDYNIHSFMVLRHGKVISEWHAAPYHADQLHMLYSASKTVMGLAVGLAVDDGLLTVDDKVSKFLRDKMPALLSPPSLFSEKPRNWISCLTVGLRWRRCTVTRFM